RPFRGGGEGDRHRGARSPDRGRGRLLVVPQEGAAPYSSGILRPLMGRRYFTTPIYYVNDRPHIGHLYTDIVTDVLARYSRFAGHEVRFLTGTDEHGQQLEKLAKAEGVPPIAIADRHVATFRELAKTFAISNA